MYYFTLDRLFWDKNRPESTLDQDSETGTLCSFPAGDDLIRETLENELQKLQLENIELKSKYQAVKNKLQNYQTLNTELESEIAMIASKDKKYPKDFIEYKANGQSRIEQLESEIEKYQLDLRTQARNNQTRIDELECENKRLASNEMKYQKDLEKEKNKINSLERQNKRLVKRKSF